MYDFRIQDEIAPAVIQTVTDEFYHSRVLLCYTIFFWNTHKVLETSGWGEMQD